MGEGAEYKPRRAEARRQLRRGLFLGRPMDPATLKCFIAVAESRSFTRAAELCNITQPALSRKIQKLEGDYGLTLFSRSTHSVELTKDGEECYHLAREVLAASEHFDHSMEALAEERGRIIKIDYVTLGEELMISRLETLHTHDAGGQNYRVKWIREKPLQALGSFMDGRIDALIINRPMLPDSPGIEKMIIREGGICAYMHESCPLAQKESIHLKDLESYPIVTFSRERGPGTYDALMRIVRDSGANLNICSYTSGCYPFRVMIDIEKNIGLMFSTSKAVIESDTVRCIPIEEIRGGFDIMIAYRSDNPKAGNLREIADALMDR